MHTGDFDAVPALLSQYGVTDTNLVTAQLMELKLSRMMQELDMLKLRNELRMQDMARQAEAMDRKWRQMSLELDQAKLRNETKLLELSTRLSRLQSTLRTEQIVHEEMPELGVENTLSVARQLVNGASAHEAFAGVPMQFFVFSSLRPPHFCGSVCLGRRPWGRRCRRPPPARLWRC
jgi:hypothetical protein